MLGRAMFLYWGRRGLSTMVYRFAQALAKEGSGALISVSANNELAPRFADLRIETEFVDTFDFTFGALTRLPRFVRNVRSYVEQLKQRKVSTVVVLMPHVWTPILGYFLRRAGIRYIVFVHDAARHTGDRTGLVQWWLNFDLGAADLIVTWSDAVAGQLVTAASVRRDRLKTLFHPLTTYDFGPAEDRPHDPLRLLFFGRIMPYKGLPLLVEALELLQRENIRPLLGIYGEGALGGLRQRLSALGAEIVNEWIEEDAIGKIYARYDIAVAPYIEASQSGPVSTALAAGMPVIVTPVGGLRAQVNDDRTGLVTDAISAAALAASIRRLHLEKDLYARLAANVQRAQAEFSMDTFICRLNALLASSEPGMKVPES